MESSADLNETPCITRSIESVVPIERAPTEAGSKTESRARNNYGSAPNLNYQVIKLSTYFFALKNT
jgi:hypothetical protein